MKKLLFCFALAGVFASPALAETDHSKLHEMMMKQGGPKPDTRIELKVPPPMKVMQKAMMRKHLDTVGAITSALAENDLAKASTIARENLGWNPSEEQRCNAVSEMTGEKDFVTLGKAVHAKADELADNAKAGKRDKALENLAQLINNCNACHEKYRH